MSDPKPLAGRRVLLGVTGGIAAYKTAELVRLLKKAGALVQVLMTREATRFVTPLTLGTLSEREVLVDLVPDAPNGSWTRHVHLGRWGELLVVAPLTANTMAKLAHGHCDSMLTAVYLSAACPVLVCPAMDHDMFEHPATQENLALLVRHGVHVMPPEEGELASGLVGKGRLPDPAAIFERIARMLGAAAPEDRSLAGRHVLVTAGPTVEDLDPVRFLSNRSTGTMGFAVAAEAARRGARVTLVTGPTSLETPAGVDRVDIRSADDLERAVRSVPDADLVVAAAAVADYAPVESSDRKLKKADDDLVLRLRRTPDVLAGLGASKRAGQVLVGFALETHDGLENARAKLERKNLDYIVLNDPNETGAGFGPDTNRVTLLSREGGREDFPVLPKAAVASLLLDRVSAPR